MMTKKCLLIEDEADTRWAITSFSRHHYDTLLAADGVSALSKAREKSARSIIGFGSARRRRL